MNNEGALIAFTLLSQMIIGATLVYALVFFTHMDDLIQLSTGFNLKTPEFLLLLGMLVATMISFLHLGKPGNAIHALNNLKTSWISREIFTLSLFSLSLLILFLVRWLGGGKPYLALAFCFTAIAGVFFLASMIRLYMIPGVNTWNTWLTPANFSLAALISGLALVLLFSMVFNLEIMRLKPILLGLLILLVFEMAHAGFLAGYLHSMELNFGNSFIAEGVFRPLTVVRMASVGLAIIFLVLVFILKNAGYQNILLVLTMILIFIEVLIGRFVFFASYVRIGI